MPATLSIAAKTSVEVASTRSRRKKVGALAQALRNLAPDELAIGVAYLSGRLPQGRIGVGPAAVERAAAAAPAPEGRLSLIEVDARLTAVAAVAGPGATARRAEALGALFASATAPEQRFLAQLLLGELRQGALEGVLTDALAEAFALPPERVRRAYMLTGDLAQVAAAAQREGLAGIDAFRIQLLQPLRPMLAQTAEDLTEALAADGGELVLEHKLDGIRVQAHKDGGQVRLFTRRLNDITPSIPELAAAVAALPAQRLVLDGEALVLDAEGRALPFQQTMGRLGNKRDVARLSAEQPVRGFFFDLLLVDDEEVFDHPLSERQRALDALLPDREIVPRLVTSDPSAADGFLRQALDAGHEGLMAKSPGSLYEAGNRGSAWLKVKQSHTLDLVVLAAEWGSGRRKRWLSNLHLGARDPAGGFVMLGKTFKGLTDAQLAWQTERLQEIALAREGSLVHVAPEVVVEIAFNEVQTSPRYPGGMALRFARVKRFRPDKSAQEADTIDAVRAIYRARFAAAQEAAA